MRKIRKIVMAALAVLMFAGTASHAVAEAVPTCTPPAGALYYVDGNFIYDGPLREDACYSYINEDRTGECTQTLDEVRDTLISGLYYVDGVCRAVVSAPMFCSDPNYFYNPADNTCYPAPEGAQGIYETMSAGGSSFIIDGTYSQPCAEGFTWSNSWGQCAYGTTLPCSDGFLTATIEPYHLL